MTGSSSWQAPPTSWWTAAIPRGRPRSERRARRWPSSSSIWLRVGQRFRRDRPICVVAGDRSGAVRHVDRAVAYRADIGNTGAAAVGGRIRNRGCAGSMGCAGRVLSPVACGTGEYIDYSRFEGVVQALDPPFGSEGQAAVGISGPTNCGGQAAQPAAVPDISVQGRIHTDLPAIAAAVARHARVAGRARAVRRPEVRHDCVPIRSVP